MSNSDGVCLCNGKLSFSNVDQESAYPDHINPDNVSMITGSFFERETLHVVVSRDTGKKIYIRERWGLNPWGIRNIDSRYTLSACIITIDQARTWLGTNGYQHRL